jgi:hypothetical protein
VSKRPQHLLRRIDGVPYLLPFGQAVVDAHRAARLDEQGAWLWERLARLPEGADPVHFLANEVMAAHGELTAGDRPGVESDMRAFLGNLGAVGALPGEGPTVIGVQPTRDGCPHRTSEASVTAGPVHMRLTGRVDLLDGAFDAFARQAKGNACATDAPASAPVEQRRAGRAGTELAVTLDEGPAPSAAGMRVLLQAPEITVCADDEGYGLFFPLAPGLRAMRVARDGSSAVLYVTDPDDLPSLSLEALAELSRGAADAPDRRFGSVRERLAFDLFHAIRQPFLVASQTAGLFVMHSCSFAYRGRAWLVSAPSGGGKSTHARLWHDEFGVPLLNGDLNLLGLADAGRDTAASARAYGIPWCGTSGVCRAFSLPLGGVILLGKATTDAAGLLPRGGERATLGVFNRLISPTWREDQLDANLAFSRGLAGSVPVWRLDCTARPSAARVMRAAIDAWLDGSGDDARV